jgi:hypothetical protein
VDVCLRRAPSIFSKSVSFWIIESSSKNMRWFLPLRLAVYSSTRVSRSLL